MENTQPAAEKPTEPTPAPAEATPVEKPQEATAATAPVEQSAEKPADTPAETTEAAKEEPKKETAEAAETKEAPAKAEEPAPAEDKPEYLAKNAALSQFFDSLAGILEKTGYNEMWGVTLKDSTDVPTVNVLIKFLRANEGNVKLAEEQLTKALEWRKQTKPLDLIDHSFSSQKFGGLGFVAKYKDTVFTWNIYGAVKDANNTFGQIDEFIKWRVALMELAIRDLKLNEATSVMDYSGEDPYQMYQVHDYKNVSFLRMNPTIKAASKKTIEVFSTAYPELLREKFFVNVPAIMGWMFSAMKLILSKNTTKKFHPITNGANLAREFSGFGDEIPKSYGGKSAELQESARTVNLKDDAPPTAAVTETPVEAAAESTEPAPAPAEKPAAAAATPAEAAAESAEKPAAEKAEPAAAVPAGEPAAGPADAATEGATPEKK